jgi:hypothetical protein
MVEARTYFSPVAELTLLLILCLFQCTGTEIPSSRLEHVRISVLVVTVNLTFAPCGR